MKLDKRESTLLRGLGKLVEVEDGTPFDILSELAATFEKLVDGETGKLLDYPDVKKRNNAGRSPPQKKRKAANGTISRPNTSIPGSQDGDDASSLDVSLDEDAEALFSEDGGLIPASLLEDAGDEYLEQFEPATLEDSRTNDDVQSFGQALESEDGDTMFQWMVSPCSQETFFSTILDMKPLFIARPNNPHYYDGCFGIADVRRLLKQGKLRYGFNIDVTMYTERDKRQNFDYNSEEQPEVLNEETFEVADEGVVWGRYEGGCSLRLLHPQRYCDPVWKLLALLEHLFQCPMGCNSYLTPAGCQGFAPHYDDVDVFILQVEGSKRWQVYPPLPDQILPRFSSPDFDQGDIGDAILDVVLKPGDMLYMPRGTIHQAQSLPDHHSLHITVSANQKRTWLDFLTPCIEAGLKELEAESLACRISMPSDYFSYMGLMHADEPPPAAAAAGSSAGHRAAGDAAPAAARRAADRQCFGATVRALMRQLVAGLPLDEVADQMCAQLLRQRLPPVGVKAPAAPLDELPPDEVTLRCTADNSARIVDEGDEECLTVYHCQNNSRTAHASIKEDDEKAGGDADGDVLSLPYFLIPKEVVGVVEQLLVASKAGVSIADVLSHLVDEDEQGSEERVDMGREVILTMYNLGLVTHEL